MAEKNVKIQVRNATNTATDTIYPLTKASNVLMQNGESVEVQFAQTLRAFTGKLTYYVNPVTGNDSNDGLSPQNAFKTITRASGLTELFYPKEDVSGHEIEIILASGDYTAESNVVGGSPFNGIRIQSSVMKSIEIRSETPNGAILGNLTAFGGFRLVIKGCVSRGVLHAKNCSNIVFTGGRLEGTSLSDYQTKLLLESSSSIWVHDTVVSNVHFLALCHTHSHLMLSLVSGNCTTLIVNYDSTGIFQMASTCTITYTNLLESSRPLILSELIGLQQFPLPLASGLNVVGGWANNYTKDAFGIVTVNLNIMISTNFGDGKILSTLPVGFRPKGGIVSASCVCTKQDGSRVFGHLSVGAGGTITIHSYVSDLRQIYSQISFNIGA